MKADSVARREHARGRVCLLDTLVIAADDDVPE
jgi:hypothetical protein